MLSKVQILRDQVKHYGNEYQILPRRLTKTKVLSLKLKCSTILVKAKKKKVEYFKFVVLL